MNVLDRHLGGDRLRLVDVGARGGIASRWDPFASLLEVTAFEPDAAECVRLNRDAVTLPYPIRYLPVAIGSEPSDAVPFHVTTWPVGSSVRRPNADFLRSFPWAERLFSVERVETIALTTLDEVAAREKLVTDFLKIDVEGAALDVLLGAEAALRETLALEVEAELNPVFTGEALFPAVDAHLRKRGWVLQGLRRTSWRRGTRLDPAASGLGGQIVSVDALYCNDAQIERGIPLIRELKLLVILSAYDLMDAVLERLDKLQRSVDRLDSEEIRELERLLLERSDAPQGVDTPALAKLDSRRRRALADQLQPGDATVWEDPHFF